MVQIKGIGQMLICFLFVFAGLQMIAKAIENNNTINAMGGTLLTTVALIWFISIIKTAVKTSKKKKAFSKNGGKE
jgi:Kef-type K+ transport system membrane component KefB